MSEYIKEYEFEAPPKKVSYIEGEPLKLTSEFTFFHNKTNIRKELVVLQNLMQENLGTPLLAAGIRDSYTKEEYSEEFLVVIFTTMEKHKEANIIIGSHINENIEAGCFFMETTPDYLLILAKEMDGLKLGIETMKEILRQTLEDYMRQKKFDDYIKIRPFTLLNCKDQ